MANRTDPKPISDKSEWIGKPRENFTAVMRELFEKQQIGSSGAALWPHELRKEVA